MDQIKIAKNAEEVGFAESIRDFLVYASGLPTIRINDMVVCENGARGWVSSLHDESVEILLLDEISISPGQMFKKTGQRMTLTVGDYLLGRAINPLGVPLDGRRLSVKNSSSEVADIDPTAHGISKREFISNQFVTGVTLIDTLVPLGQGQRELIMGDARSGKTSFLIDTIVNQAQSGVICIYASIGKPIAEVRALIDVLHTNKALAYTIVIATSSTDIAPMIFLTPHAAMTVAEYFQKQGKDVLVILDDLGNHAKIYREMSLLAGRAPGRESYPGDIFYQHAHLLERAGNFNNQVGGGSITALPVIELNLNDFTSLIPTNIMAMTDGHILFNSSLSSQGHRPAVDIGLSVSRVGRQTQNRLQNDLAFKIKQVLSSASQLETVSRFSTELPIESQLLLKQKDQITEMINQPALTNIPLIVQTLMLALVFTPFLQYKDGTFVEKNKTKIIEAFMKDPEFKSLVEIAQGLHNLDELILKIPPYISKLEQICQQ